MLPYWATECKAVRPLLSARLKSIPAFDNRITALMSSLRYNAIISAMPTRKHIINY